MIEITLTLDKSAVYHEVGQTTSYTGAKMNDDSAYERIFTTDADDSMLDRFWSESKITIANHLKRVLLEENDLNGVYSLKIGVSDSFNESLVESMQLSLFSFFVMNITAKWYTFTNKQEAAGYAAEAATYVDDLMRKVFFKKKPARPRYDNNQL